MCLHTENESEGQMELYTHPHTLSMSFWCPAYDMNMEELEQKAQ